MSFNFKDTEVASGFSFLTPGVYPLTPVDVVYGTHSTGTPYAAITFVNESGVKLVEKFNITDTTINRLQYFHKAFFGKLCDKTFATPEEVASYFGKCVKAKKITKNVIVGGNINGGKVYAQLVYTNFVDEDGKFPLGEFEKDGEEWKQYVTAQKSKTEGTAQGRMSSNDDDDKPARSAAKPTKKESVEADALPWD